MERSRLGVPGDAAVYLCVQSLFKYLPRHDALLARIAAAVPAARFVFLGHPRAAVTTAFSRRLGAEFARQGVALDGRAVFLPRLSHADYLAVNLAADVFLDRPEWSGGNTTLEAIACGLPVVTLPGTFMRGRHSAAILEQLDLSELIATSEDDYVAIATALGLDPLRRSRARALIDLHAESRLFGQRSAVEAFEAWALSKKFHEAR
jgi:predicted O-linked N-acetylglucosamine transferase (SPINDLY family)